MQTQLQEPLKLKGTLAHPIRKGNASAGKMADFRFISIRTHTVKTHRTFLRNKFKELAELKLKLGKSAQETTRNKRATNTVWWKRLPHQVIAKTFESIRMASQTRTDGHVEIANT